MKKTLLIILMILAISVIFILPQLPVQKLFDDPSESLIEADNSNEISQSRIAEKTKYRNNPEWQIAIDLQRRLPDLPLILDPSHIAGRRDLIFDLCQTALDLNYDGLMIESHNDPDNAWSDAKQQVTPEVLSKMKSDLKIKDIKKIKKASRKIFPIKFSDVHPLTKNLNTTKEKINLMETFWIGSGFKASKEKLLSLLS